MTADPDELLRIATQAVTEALAQAAQERIGVVEAAAIIGVHRSTITRWAAAGRIPGATTDDLGRTSIPRTWATNHPHTTPTKDNQ